MELPTRRGACQEARCSASKTCCVRPRAQHGCPRTKPTPNTVQYTSKQNHQCTLVSIPATGDGQVRALRSQRLRASMRL